MRAYDNFIAFSILSIVTAVTVSVVTQNSIRSHRIEKQLIAMEIAENVLAEINGKIVSENLQNDIEYKGDIYKSYEWKAVVDSYDRHSGFTGANRMLPLWRVNLQVFDKLEKQSLFQITTVVPGK